MISIPPLKSLAHNKYQVGGRQLLLAVITLHHTSPNQAELLLFLKHFLSWMECKFNLRQEVNIPQNSELVSCSDDRFQKNCSCWFSETWFLSSNSKSLTIL